MGRLGKRLDAASYQAPVMNLPHPSLTSLVAGIDIGLAASSEGATVKTAEPVGGSLYGSQGRCVD